MRLYKSLGFLNGLEHGWRLKKKIGLPVFELTKDYSLMTSHSEGEVFGQPVRQF
jgi:hypothetical protein